MNQFSRIESFLENSYSYLEKGLNSEDFASFLEVYSKVFTFYNNSLDIFRKFLVYFPVEDFQDFTSLYTFYSKLSGGSKKKVLNFTKELLNEELKSNDR